jgi:cobalt-zinc-cadmium efflux system outer membrane protein
VIRAAQPRPHAVPLRALALAAFLLSGVVAAQVPSPTMTRSLPPPSLTFSTYLSTVARANVELAAQRAGVPVAEAQIAIARIFPDPVLTVGLASLDVSGVGAQNNAAVGLTIPFEWPTKRPARVAVARAEREVVAADLEDFARTLRAAAASAYVDALLARRVLLRRQQAFESLAGVATANEQRQREGAVAEIVALQARVEARRYRGDVITAEGDARASRFVLASQMGLAGAAAERLPASVDGELRVPPRTFVDADLIAHALATRPDLRARQRGIRAAQARIDLAHANRGVDVALSLGWLYYTPGQQGSAYQGPPYHTVNAMLSVPLPISRVLNGEVQAAEAGRTQAEAQRAAAELRVAAEIRAALARYDAARERLAQYDEALLADNDRLLEMARYAYAQGASRLIELLSAQRTWTDTYIAYETALADHARALIALETAAGMWDLAL